MWHSPDNFFKNILASDLAPIFNTSEFVWDALDQIGPFLKKNLKPNVGDLAKNGGFLTTPAAICQNEVITEGIEYELGDPATLELKVYQRGQLLPEAALIMAGAVITDSRVEIGPGAIVESGAMIKGPCRIGAFSEVRQGAYIRGAVISCPGAVIGHTTEAKNTILLEGAKAGHFAYLGDSILGRQVNLGAGTKLANLKMVDRPYHYAVDGVTFTVNRRKFGAIIGDHTETGCNCVTSPGTMLSPGCMVTPNLTVASDWYPRGKILRNR